MRLRISPFIAGPLLSLAACGFASAGQFEDGIAALQRGDYAASLKRLRPLAAKNNADAQFNVGWMYETGKGVPVDYKLAADWYRKAADLGNARAEEALGIFYGIGRVFPQDYGQAIVWTRKAADQDFAPAERTLGEAYEKGAGVPKDYALAVFWYRKAAYQDDADALNSLDRLSHMDNQELQLIASAKQCSEVALIRYALTSTEPAESVAHAAFDKCIDLWRQYGEAAGWKIAAQRDLIVAQINCKRLGSNCPVELPASLYAINAAEAMFIHDATIKVFDIRAEAAGK